RAASSELKLHTYELAGYQFGIGIGDGTQQPAARIELVTRQLVGVQLQLGELAARRQRPLGGRAVAVGRRHIEIGAGPQTVIAAAVADDLGAPAVAERTDRRSQRL